MNPTAAPTTEFYNSLVNLWGGPEMTLYYGEHQADERHRECFDALAGVLRRFEMSNAFEVYLTHRHYLLEPGEVLVSRFEDSTEDWLLIPELQTDFLTPVTFCFDGRGVPIEIVYVDSSEVEPMTNAEIACLKELGKVICAAGLEKILGASRVFRERGSLCMQRYNEGSDALRQRCQRSTPVERYIEDSGGIHTHWRLVNSLEWVVAGNCYGSSH